MTQTEIHEMLAKAFERAGARDSAAVHYRRVALAWRDLMRASAVASWKRRASRLRGADAFEIPLICLIF